MEKEKNQDYYYPLNKGGMSCNETLKNFGNCEVDALNAASKVTLKWTAMLISTCSLFIRNDSVPLHIATVVGTPVVGIY